MSHKTESHTLYVREGAEYRVATSDEMLSTLNRILAQRFQRGSPLDSPDVVRGYLKVQLAHLEHEVFCMLALDSRHRVLIYQELFRGTIDGSSVHPREVVKEALKHNAAAVLFVHNHPSGVSTPSEADRLITRRLQDALSLVEVRVLDHLIVGGETVSSFAEMGLL